MAQYAQLSNDKSTVVNLVDIDPNFIASAKAQSNPKADFYLPVTNVAQPAFDPATQAAVQNGWTINPGVDVQPVWQVVTLTAQQQQDYQNASNARAQLVTSDLQTAVSDLQGYLSSWPATPTAAQMAAVLKRVVQIELRLCQALIVLIRRAGGS